MAFVWLFLFTLLVWTIAVLVVLDFVCDNATDEPIPSPIVLVPIANPAESPPLAAVAVQPTAVASSAVAPASASYVAPPHPYTPVDAHKLAPLPSSHDVENPRLTPESPVFDRPASPSRIDPLILPPSPLLSSFTILSRTLRTEYESKEDESDEEGATGQQDHKRPSSHSQVHPARNHQQPSIELPTPSPTPPVTTPDIELNQESEVELQSVYIQPGVQTKQGSYDEHKQAPA
jgi:hypothetical protein